MNPLAGAALGAALVLAAPAVAQTPGYGGGEAQPITDARALSPFFRVLSAMQSGQRQEPVRIIQIGDSLTANDYITTGLRAQLQARFGAGGRGPMTVGSPYRGYHPDQVETDQTEGWRMEASFAGKGSGGPDFVSPGPFGLSGWRLSTDQPGQTATLDAHVGAFFDQATLCGLARPGGGAVEMTAGDQRERIDFNTAAQEVVCHTVHYPTVRSHLDVTTEGGPVSLLSWSTERAAAGIVLSNMGVAGTQLSDFAGRDDQALRAEFDAYEPDLILLAYGVNEGYRPVVDGEAYESLLRHEIERLKRLAPSAAIMVLGTPDADTVRPDIYGTGRAAAFGCAPLSTEEAANYEQLAAARSPSLLRWFPPVGLATVRSAQRRAAAEEGVAYWDWEARMGGPCSAHALVHADPPLVRGDHIHFTPEGGQWLGGRLAADLTAAYASGGR